MHPHDTAHQLSYGATLDAVGVRRFLGHVLDVNDQSSRRGEPGTPLCIWGTHGIGKTALVEQLVAGRGWELAYAAPAQFEEMGDLHGLPVRDGDNTVFAPPDWVPTRPGPGVLLLDDLNRADDRILRGLMQLLQRGEMVSWALPERWQIVATANPEGGDYSVTPMDDAMLTRMLHVSMRFEARAWARWATASGVDPRGIDFVLTYPEAVTGRRTTARSLTQFFTQIRDLDDLAAERDLVHALAASAMDETTAATFLAFVDDGLEGLVSPEEILEAKDFAPIAARITHLGRDRHGVRMDRLATVCTRVYLTVTAPGYAPGPSHGPNLVRLMTLPALPNDLRATLHRDLLRDGGAPVAEMIRVPELADLVMAAL